jgi:hypothetical protein
MQSSLFTGSKNRRQFLKNASCGFGFLALADLCTRAVAAEAQDPLAPKATHFAARAKHVIFLFMGGAPSHVDTFDYKPRLQADDGKSVDDKGKGRKFLKSPFKFAKHGKSGLWLPEIFPHLAQHADDLCLLNSMYTDVAVHGSATTQLHTGNFRLARPSMGAWAVYGLGSENSELPGFISFNGVGGTNNYASAFLPATYQGTRIDTTGGVRRGGQLANIENPRLAADLQRKQLDLLAKFNQDQLSGDRVNPELEALIESYELAFRMQGAVPKVMDIASETKAIQESYGIGERGTDAFGRQCLLARRFVEAGVRFVELGMGGWDQHNNLKAKLTSNAHAIDKPIAGLLQDLKQRDLLKHTLIVWGGEFGRTPTAQNNDGRDHNNRGFSMWMAGGGTKGGYVHGSTDEHGAAAVEKKMHIHDLHATMLYLLGLDHEKLTFRYSGRDFRLTDVAGVVAKDVVA